MGRPYGPHVDSASGYAINYGIKTGLNEAFVIDNETRDALIAEDPRSAEIIKPALRGRDIKRFRAAWQGLWLIGTFPALDLSIDDYPAVKRHFLSFGKDRLEQSGRRLADGTRARKKTGNDWFETQDACAYHADFSKEKLLWMGMTPEPRFAYSESEIFGIAQVYIVTGPALKYLGGVLNSTLVNWYMLKTCITTGMGLIEWKVFAVSRIPLPLVPESSQEPVATAVNEILVAKDSDPVADTQQLERMIDRYVYSLYGLTSEEIASVEKALR